MKIEQRDDMEGHLKEFTGSIDLVICDTFGRLTNGNGIKTFTTKEERDQYISDIQSQLITIKGYLRDEETVGSMIIGVNTFSMKSFGKDVFGDNAKRVLVWNQDKLPLTDSKRYTDNRAYFMWGVHKRGWLYNLEEGEHFFTGEFLQSNEKYSTALKVARSIIRRFSNKGSNVFELNPLEGSVIKQATELENRNYFSGEVRGRTVYANKEHDSPWGCV